MSMEYASHSDDVVAPVEVVAPSAPVAAATEVPEPPPVAALDRIEGPDASYFLFAFPDLSLLAYSIDQGLIGASDNDLCDATRVQQQSSAAADADGSGSASTRHCKVVIAVVSPGVALGYAVVLGAAQPRAVLKEVVKKEMPRAWANVVRVGWVRVASVSAVELRSLLEQRGLYAPPSAALSSRHGGHQEGSGNVRLASLQPTDEATVAQRKRARVEDCINACEHLPFPVVNHDGNKDASAATQRPSLWLAVGRDVGALLCHAIDETSITVLPYDLRAVQGSSQQRGAYAAPGNAMSTYRQRQEMQARPPQTTVGPPPGNQPTSSSTGSHSQYTVEQYRSWLQLYYPHLSPPEMEACAQQYYHAQFQQPSPEHHQHRPSTGFAH